MLDGLEVIAQSCPMTLSAWVVTDRPAQHRPFQVRQIFTLIGFAPENFSQIFDGYEFTPKIISQI